MNSIAALILFACLIGTSQARRGSGEHGGGSLGSGSGEHGGTCLVVSSTTTTCTGATGTSCFDSASLITLLKTGSTSVLVCSGRSSVPRMKSIQVRLAVQSCKRCTCFTAASTETRTCSQLRADTTFVKNSCSNQASLIALLNAGAGTAKVCMFNRFGVLALENNAVPILASVNGEHHWTFTAFYLLPFLHWFGLQRNKQNLIIRLAIVIIFQSMNSCPGQFYKPVPSFLKTALLAFGVRKCSTE